MYQTTATVREPSRVPVLDFGWGVVVNSCEAIYDAVWGDLGGSGKIWEDLGRSGTVWDDLRRCGTIWEDPG